MRTFTLAVLLLLALPAFCLSTVMVQDFEGGDVPKLWGVNHQADNAVSFSADKPFSGAQCLKVHYHFVQTDKVAYLGIPNPVKVAGPVTLLRFALNGDGTRCGINAVLTDANGETHQYKRVAYSDFQGWREIAVKLADNHETWGGDKNGVINYPISGITFTVVAPTALPALGDLYFDAVRVDTEAAAPVVAPPATGKPKTVMIESYEGDVLPDVVGSIKPLPSFSLSKDGPADGAQCLKVAYAFPDARGLQFFRVVNAVNLTAISHAVRFKVKGTGGCPVSMYITDAGGEAHVFKRLGAADTAAWKELSVNLDAAHESFGGDKNGQIDFPVPQIMLTIAAPPTLPAAGELFIDALSVEAETAPDGTVRVVAPRTPAVPAGKLMRLPVQGYETADGTPTYSGTMKDQPGIVTLSTDTPQAGAQCVKLHYAFPESTKPQYARLTHAVKIEAPIHTVQFQVKNTGACPLGLQVVDGSGETHVYRGFGAADSPAWKEITVDLDPRHECWGGDKNGKVDAPVTHITLTVYAPKTLPAEGDLCLDALTVGAEEAVLLDAVPTEKDGLYWGPGAVPAVTVKLTALAGAALTTPVKATLYNYRRAAVRTLWDETARVTPGTPQTKTLSLAGLPFGTYDLEVQAGATQRTVHLCWLPERATPWQESPFGVCVHFSQRQYRDVPGMAKTIRDMGASWMRDSVVWSRMQGKDGLTVPDYIAEYLDAAKKNDLQLLLLLHGGSKTVDEGNAPYTDEGRDAFTEYAVWAVSQLKDYCTTWEIWNEPDNKFWPPKPDPAAHAALVKTVYAALKETPDGKAATVLSGGPSYFHYPFITTQLANGIGTSLDGYCMHPYGIHGAPDTSSFLENLAKLRGMLDAAGAKGRGIWFTEFGDPTQPFPKGVPTDLAAAYMVRKYLLALAQPGVTRLFYYDIRDDGANPDDGECNFGLLRFDGTAKPGFVAFNTMARLLARTAYTRSLLETPHTRCLEFSGAGGHTLVAWAKEGAGTLAFATTQREVTVTDLMGNARTIAARNGRICMPLTFEPVFITRYGTPSPAPALASLGDTVSVMAGSPATVTLAADAALGNGPWTVTAPDGWTLTPVPGAPRQWHCQAPATVTVGGDHALTAVAADGTGAGARLVVRDPLAVTGDNVSATAVRLTLGNDFPTPMAATYQVTIGDKVGDAKPVTVPAGQAVTIEIPTGGQGNGAWQCVPVDVTVRVGDTWRKFVRILNGVTPCSTVPLPPVDGDPAKWQALPPCVLQSAYQVVTTAGQAWGGTDDLSARFWLANDGTQLRLAVLVTDDKPSQENPADGMWLADCVQFALSANDTRYELGVALHDKGHTLTAQWSPDARLAREDYVAKARRIGNQTFYELAIPWKALGITPGVTPLRFALLVNDSDGKGRKGWIEWFKGIGDGKDPTRYAPVTMLP
jgi:hypothetical protein